MTWKTSCLESLADVVKWTPPPWLADAACRRDEYKKWWWFIPERQDKRKSPMRSKALLVCRHNCPVRWKCLARYIEEPAGIFGGFDLMDRTRITDRWPKKLYTNPTWLQNKYGPAPKAEEGTTVVIRVS